MQIKIANLSYVVIYFSFSIFRFPTRLNNEFFKIKENGFFFDVIDVFVLICSCCFFVFVSLFLFCFVFSLLFVFDVNLSLMIISSRL